MPSVLPAYHQVPHTPLPPYSKTPDAKSVTVPSGLYNITYAESSATSSSQSSSSSSSGASLSSAPSSPRSSLDHSLPNHLATELETQARSDTEDNYVFSNEYMTLNLGPRVWDTEQPAYGRGSIVSGYITMKKKLRKKDILRVYIRGRISSIAKSSKRSLTPPSSRFLADRMLEVKPREDMEDSMNDESDAATQGPYPFHLRFPSHCLGTDNVSLPPTTSFTAASNRIEIGVDYIVRVQLLRQWWKGDVSLDANVLYLPKSCPKKHTHKVAALPDNYDWKSRDPFDRLEWKSIEVPCSSNNTTASVKLELLQPLAYPNTAPLHYRIKVKLPSMSHLSPREQQKTEAAFETMLRDPRNCEVSLSRSAEVMDWSGVLTRCDCTLGRGVIMKVDRIDASQAPLDEDEDGTYKIYGNIELRPPSDAKKFPGGEVSWHIPGVGRMQHCVKFMMKLPFGVYRHVEAINLTTHSREELYFADDLTDPVLANVSTRPSRR